MATKGGLGRGLGSLIPSRSAQITNQTKKSISKFSGKKSVGGKSQESIYQINISEISPNPNQPRQDFPHRPLGVPPVG